MTEILLFKLHFSGTQVALIIISLSLLVIGVIGGQLLYLIHLIGLALSAQKRSEYSSRKEKKWFSRMFMLNILTTGIAILSFEDVLRLFPVIHLIIPTIMFVLIHKKYEDMRVYGMLTVLIVLNIAACLYFINQPQSSLASMDYDVRSTPSLGPN